MKRITSISLMAFLFSTVLLFSPSNARADESRVDAARRFLLANVSPADGAKGSVIASPSTSKPNYYFHWVRDSSLVMEVVLRMAEVAPTADEKQRYTQMLWDFADFSRRNQETPNTSGDPLSSGLGEPKFHVDGKAFNEDWGRPQSDGPALRALILTRFARKLMKESNTSLVSNKLYQSAPLKSSVIKTDLEYLKDQWTAPSYDIWEEFKADHFYTRLVQRRALIEGAELARLLGDTADADKYQAQAELITKGRAAQPAVATKPSTTQVTTLNDPAAIGLDAFYDERGGYIRTMLNWKDGTPEERKSEGLDSSVILAVLHAQSNDGYFTVDDQRVLKTASVLEAAFAKEYAVNRVEKDREGRVMAPAIGRYLHDQYDGVVTTGRGNPWFLTTHAFAELHYQLARTLETKGFIKITDLNAQFLRTALEKTGHNADVTHALNTELKQTDPRFADLMTALRERGDQYMLRSNFHAAFNGAMAEQINRETGIMQGAADLTWSYASYLSAVWSR